MEKIRRKWGVPKNGYPVEERGAAHARLYWEGNEDNDHSDYSELGNDFLPPTTKVRGQLRALSSRFNLDYRWHASLYTHILGGGKIDPPFENVNIEVRLNDVRLPKEQWVVKSLKIEIYKETRLNDIRKVWKKVKEWQDMMPAAMPDRKRTSRNVDRYVAVRELEEKCFSHRQILEQAKLGFGNDVKAVSQLKSEMESRFSSGQFKKIRTLMDR